LEAKLADDEELIELEEREKKVKTKKNTLWKK
jgi:hypothetical protein